MWCIKGCKELENLFVNTNLMGNRENRFYFHKNVTNDYLNSKEWNWSEIPKGEIISVEEFKQKNKNSKEKKIIGYKLSKLEYLDAACLIAKLIIKTLNVLNELMGDLKNDWIINRFKEAGVLDIWFEPVYEETKKKIIKMHSSNKGEFEIEIINGKAFYRPDNKELTKEFIEEILDWYDDSSTHSRNATHLMYCLKVEELTVGCMKGTRKEDWLKVLKEIN